MFDLVVKIHQVLNLIKDFEVGYSTASDGKFLICYKGKRYYAKLEEIENPSEDVFDDLKRIKYWN